MPVVTGRGIDEDDFREHSAHVWAIAYRVTGSAADADDLVQETFVRAMSAKRAEELRPWLARIATNASIDVLRARRRTPYIGPWLPEPIDTGDASGSNTGGARYDLLESVSLAFMIALEALSPRARAVLLLRDVFDYSVRQTSTVLTMTETHVKVTHHRARKVMEAYDASRRVPTRELQDKAREALFAMMSALAVGDLSALEALLAEDAQTINDSAGDYTAARVPVIGNKKIALFWTKVRPREIESVEMRMLNGLPAVVARAKSPDGRLAPCIALTLTLNSTGRIATLHGIVATAKLARLLDGKRAHAY